MKDTSPTTLHCLENTLSILGDKWTALILHTLQPAPATFSRLETELGSISPRTLSQRLDYLETEKIIEKICYCERPPRFEYGLTAKGKELRDVLGKMSDWGAKYH